MLKLMIIDDEPHMIPSLSRLASRHGYQHCSAQNGKMAIEIFEKEKPDIVLLDLNIPEIPGEKIYKIIKGINADTKIYFVSGSSPELDRLKVSNIGASGYILKPFDMDDIKKLLIENKK